MSEIPETDDNGVQRDGQGRFRPGGPPPNPAGRRGKGGRKREDGIDDALLGAVAKKVLVSEDGKRRRKSKLDVTATQLVNQGAGGNLRATKMLLDQVRKAEERAERQAASAPIMTESDMVIAARVVAQIEAIVRARGCDETEAS